MAFTNHRQCRTLHSPEMSRPVSRIMNKLLFHVIWVLLLGTFGQSFGQTSSPLGRFEVDYIKGCTPLTVSITDLLGDPTAQYLYDADTCVVSSPKYDPAVCPRLRRTLAQVVRSGIRRTSLHRSSTSHCILPKAD